MTSLGEQSRYHAVYLHSTGYFIGSALPMHEVVGGDTPSPVVVWAMTNDPADGRGVELIRATSPQGLWEALNHMRGHFTDVTGLAMTDQTVHLYMPCGETLRYIALDDIPWTDVPCPCGNPLHWVLRYTAV